MTCFPTRETFRQLAAEFEYVPVYRRLISDALTPVSAFHRINSGVHACLFESVIGGEKVGRYSFLAAEPFLLFEATGNKISITEYAKPGVKKTGEKSSAESQENIETTDSVGSSSKTFEAENPLEELRRQVAKVRVAQIKELPPFTGGAIGYAGYDTVRYVENLPNSPEDDRNLPDLSFAFYDHMIVFDNVQKTIVIVAYAKIPKGADEAAIEHSYQRAADRLTYLTEKLSAEAVPLPMADIDISGKVTLPFVSNFTQDRFKSAVKKCVEYIRAGDIFQVVLSQRFEMDLTIDPFEVYRTLRVVNPSPFMFYVRTPQCTLVGSSPEIMVRVMGREVTVRPLAGTRKRGLTEEEDNRLAEELLSDPKEIAEHVMLVDLGRNDVGRIAEFGSVKLSETMTIERYSHVMHISTNVDGTLKKELDAFDALAACLPVGTVSGAPKVRAMQIIDELEPHRRGPYAGAVGYIDFAGNMDTCIALRTLVIQENKAYIQAGAGIVADSDPEAEYQETLNKACGLMKAVEISCQRVGTE